MIDLANSMPFPYRSPLTPALATPTGGGADITEKLVIRACHFWDGTRSAMRRTAFMNLNNPHYRSWLLI